MVVDENDFNWKLLLLKPYKTYQTHQTHPTVYISHHFTSFHMLNSIFVWHLEISPKHRASISSGPRGLYCSWPPPRPPPPAAPGTSPRGRRAPQGAARWRRGRPPSRPRRRAPSAAGAGPRRGGRAGPPGRCRCRLGATGRPREGAPVAGPQRPQRRPKKSWNTSNVFYRF